MRYSRSISSCHKNYASNWYNQFPSVCRNRRRSLQLHLYANLSDAIEFLIILRSISIIFADNWICTYTNIHPGAAWKEFFRNRDVSPPSFPLSLSLSLSTSIPHSPGGGQCLGDGHISSTLGGGRGGRSKKSYRAKTIISAR